MKKFMKRILVLALTLSMCATFLTACTKKTDENSSTNQSNTSSDADNSEATVWVPTDDVTILCGYSAGGSTDLFARLVAQYLSNYWGVNVIVDNVTGGSGAIAMTQCLQSAPDGLTVTISNGASLTLSASGNVDWSYSDFTNLAKLIDEDELLCVKSDSQFNSMSEFISYCKEHPGEVSIGFAGVGGFTYLAAQKFIADMGIDVKTVAYDSGSEVVTAVMGGFVDFCMQQPAELASGLESGALKCLATMSDEHHPSELLASVPTSKEEGFEFITTQWRGISAPGDLPENIKEGWLTALKAVADDPDFQNDATNSLLARVNPLLGSDMDEFMDADYKWIEPLMQQLGLIS